MTNIKTYSIKIIEYQRKKFFGHSQPGKKIKSLMMDSLII